MSSFALDPLTGDLLITDNSITLNSGLEAIRQHLQVRFQLFLGEWAFNTALGVPWFRDILIKKPSFIVVHETLKAVVLETPGVLELTDYNFVFDSPNREAHLSFSCLTQEGEIDFSQIVEIG